MNQQLHHLFDSKPSPLIVVKRRRTVAFEADPVAGAAAADEPKPARVFLLSTAKAIVPRPDSAAAASNAQSAVARLAAVPNERHSLKAPRLLRHQIFGNTAVTPAVHESKADVLTTDALPSARFREPAANGSAAIASAMKTLESELQLIARAQHFLATFPCFS